MEGGAGSRPASGGGPELRSLPAAGGAQHWLPAPASLAGLPFHSHGLAPLPGGHGPSKSPPCCALWIATEPCLVLLQRRDIFAS